jgi:hypothetical protein
MHWDALPATLTALEQPRQQEEPAMAPDLVADDCTSEAPHGRTVAPVSGGWNFTPHRLPSEPLSMSPKKLPDWPGGERQRGAHARAVTRARPRPDGHPQCPLSTASRRRGGSCCRRPSRRAHPDYVGTATSTSTRLKGRASSLLLKDAPRAELVQAVRTVAAGETLLAPAITRKLIDAYVRRPPPREGASSRCRRLRIRARATRSLLP